MNSQSNNEKKHVNESDLAAAVASALTHLSKAQEALPLDDDLIDRDRKAAIALIKFPTKALEAASQILASEPERLSSFDASAVNDSLAYDVAMTKVLRQAQALVTTIQHSLWKRRAPGMEQTLALYAWLKRGSVRINGSLSKYVDALAPHIALRRKGKTKATEPASPGTSGASAPAITH